MDMRFDRRWLRPVSGMAVAAGGAADGAAEDV
jgi:hypothetical protein